MHVPLHSTAGCIPASAALGIIHDGSHTSGILSPCALLGPTVGAAAVLGVRHVRATFLDHLSAAEACSAETCINSKLENKLRVLPQGEAPAASSQTIPTAVGVWRYR